MADGVKNSQGIDAHRGIKFGAFGRSLLAVMMSRASSIEGWTLIYGTCYKMLRGMLVVKFDSPCQPLRRMFSRRTNGLGRC